MAVAEPGIDPFADWRPTEAVSPSAPTGQLPATDPALSVAVLDDPHLVLTDGYIGRERRRLGTRARVGRATWAGRRRLLRLDLLIVVALVATVVGAALLMAAGRPAALDVPVHPTSVASGAAHVRTPTAATSAAPAAATPPAGARAAGAATVPGATPAPAAAAAAATAAAPAPTPAPTSVPVASAPPVVATTNATSAAAPGSPEAMGAAALAMIRYPWQQIPGYSIMFHSIGDAPSPGYYGNTDFTWGRTGGVSDLYVYPGESVERLAAITAFEIGHEVDAAYVESQGGHDAIESILGIHPASWAPQCDCAEQGYLSGWYAAAFSDNWSPGVGEWSSLAPEPSGATLTAMLPWLDPRVP